MLTSPSKTRRKKCDEEKPTCRRCRDDQFKCDGYAPIPSRKKTPPAQRDVPTCRRATATKSKSHELDLAKCRSRNILPGARVHLDLDTDGPDGIFLNHFRSITIIDFIRVANPKDFWFRRVLPMCHEDPVIRNVVVALGAAHRSYLDKLSQPHPQDANAPMTYFERVAVSLYNEAIRKVVNLDVKTSKSGDSEARFLICCLLFVCLEYMLGRFDEAVRHIKAGCQLLAASDLSTAPKDVRHLIQETATVLVRLNVDASIPPQQYDIPNMTPHAKPLMELDGPSKPFTNLAEAKDAIWDLDVKMAYSSHGQDDDSRQPMDMLGCPDYIDDGCDDEEWQELSASFEIWKAKFGLLISSLGNFNSLPMEVQREILVLTAQRYMWDIILYPIDNPKDEGLRRLCDRHIEVIEQTYHIEASTLARPVFTLDSDTIPAMFHAANYSKDPVLTQRVVGLLRKYRRREGLWDSWEVADMLSKESHMLDYSGKHIRPIVDPKPTI